MTDFRDRIGVEYAVVQAGLGGGIARAELAAAVSRAGGLGTVCSMASPRKFRDELRRARSWTEGRPISANLLFPAIQRGHVEACISERVPVVSLFFGFDARVVRALHDAGAFVLHQVGTADEARRALHEGADGLIAQGTGAGGHVLAKHPLADIVPWLVDLARDKPVLASGGVHDRASAENALSLGASGVWVGTRFLLTHESHAHSAYKARLLAASATLETLLFGVGWHALHRVVPNAATERWCSRDPLGPSWVRALNRATEPLTRRAPVRAISATLGRQRLEVPFYTPAPLTRGMDERWVDLTPLYAGKCVAQIASLSSAADVVRDLAVR